MKIFANKSIWKKIVIAFLLSISIFCTKPEPVYAGIGGELMEPVCDVLVGLADGFMNLTHSILIGQETTLIRIGLNSDLTTFFRVAITAIVFLAVLATAAAVTAGGALAVGAVTGALSSTAVAAAGGTAVVVKTIATSAIIANIVPILVGSTYFGVKAYGMDAFDNEIDLPLYSISPERIFSNTIPLFDVNFFHPSAEPYKYEWIHKTSFGDKYQPVYNTSDISFDNAEDITTDEMKQKIASARGKYANNIDKIKRTIVDGKTYIYYEWGHRRTRWWK